MMRRDFEIIIEDQNFLKESGFQWETIIDRGMLWLIIEKFPVPAGYNLSEVSVAIKVETGYPRAPLDMAYFSPPLERLDLKLINATSTQDINGRKFQRWSRHRTVDNPWREGIDDLSTHLSLVSFWFEQEFIKHANGIST